MKAMMKRNVAVTPPVTLGLRENRGQFVVLILVNAFVGTMVGVERSILTPLAESEFGLASATVALTFLVAFGVAKALSNLVAGELADRVGRRRILITGWLFGLPVPVLLLWAPTWGWIVFANVLLGVNQGLAWSTTVIMKIDLVGPRQRGLAMGLNEFAGYVAVGIAALATGYLAGSVGAGEAAFWIGGGAAVAGISLTLLLVRDTGAHVVVEEDSLQGRPRPISAAEGVQAGLRRLRSGSPALFAANQAGFVNNLNDGVAWGLFPLYLSAAGLSLDQIGWVAAIYPATWGVSQIATGALSDRLGRRALISWGMVVQALALTAFAAGSGFTLWMIAAVVLGLGTAAVYPTLIAQVSDLVTPRQRASRVGVYRLWRDLGYVAGGIGAGLVADAAGFRVAIAAVAALTAVSGILAWRRLPSGRAAKDQAGFVASSETLLTP